MKIQNDIKKFLQRNSIVTYSCVIITIATLAFHFLSISRIVNESKNHVYMINSKGDVIPAEYMNRRDNIEIEIQNHLAMIVDNFYSLNQLNWENKTVNKGFYLANLENIHRDRTNKGYYNRFIQFSIEQHASLPLENIEITPLNHEHFEFKIIINVSDNYEGKINNWIVFARGKAKLTDRDFPKNPHGVWVYEYIEDRIEKARK